MNTPETNLSRGLDFYKLTMGDVIYNKHPDADVTFTLKNRDIDYPLSQYVSADALQLRLDAIRGRGFSTEEITYYGGLLAQNGDARFTAEYLDHLANVYLPDVSIGHNELGDLAVSSCGAWADVSLWETVVMSEVNEEYYQQLIKTEGLRLKDVLAEGDRRLSDKITRLQARPDIKFADFGTRRRFSADWHEHTISRLVTECPDNFVGTSNPWFAYKYDITPVGTFAHEMPMVYAGLADAAGDDPLTGHTKMLQDWQEHYNGDLSIALTDTFGSDFFFSDFSAEQADQWRGLRHDSGDPVAFGEHVIAFYKELGIDPTVKTLIFSDGLNIDTIEALADHFGSRIGVVFGWGTTLMNDLGLRPNNFVMKATHVNDKDTVKLSDDVGKHTGPEALVARYQLAAMKYIGARALQQAVLA